MGDVSLGNWDAFFCGILCPKTLLILIFGSVLATEIYHDSANNEVEILIDLHQLQNTGWMNQRASASQALWRIWHDGFADL